jgi:hypothetical protein
MGARVALQTVASPVAVAGTVAAFALLLSLTAHVAARNVLGDVNPVRALGVGPVPAVLATLPQAFDVPSFLALGVALVADATAFHLLYDLRPRLTAYVTLIHVVVSIILGAIVFGLLALIASVPG